MLIFLSCSSLYTLVGLLLSLHVVALSLTNTMSYTYPKVWSFPPFFTKQPNKETYDTQVNEWIKIIHEYCKSCKVWKITRECPVFTNTAIRRQLETSFIEEIFRELERRGGGSIVSDGVYIWWYTLEEWSSRVYEWVEDNGQKGVMMTVFELEGQFDGMPYDMMEKVLRRLEKQGKVTTVVERDEIVGVKF